MGTKEKAVEIAVKNVSGRRRWSKQEEWLRPERPKWWLGVSVKHKHWRQLLEVSIALEIAKRERDAFRDKATTLESQLADAVQRARDAETRLHETTTMLFQVSRDAIGAGPRSTATEVMIDGRSVLRLGQPVFD